jgi:DNA-binding Lrp family transcriptional regulator
MQNSVDSLDKRILRELLRDSRKSFRQLAEGLNVSVGTVLKRVKDMETKGIIKGYSVLLDQEKLGYDLTAVTEVTVSKGKLVEMETEIAKLPNVCALYDTTGLPDVIVIAKFKDRKELSDYAKYLLRLPFVERTNTHVVLGTVKEEFRLL